MKTKEQADIPEFSQVPSRRRSIKVEYWRDTKEYARRSADQYNKQVAAFLLFCGQWCDEHANRDFGIGGLGWTDPRSCLQWMFMPVGIDCQCFVAGIFHTILLFRSTGKYNYKDETSYSIGTLGVVDVNCDFLDLTYVRADSDQLDQYLKKEAEKFSKTLRLNEAPHTQTPHSGEIVLTFYQKKKKQWPFAQECVPWEMWTLNLKVIHLPNEHERNAYRSSLGMLVGEKIITAAEIISRDQYVPRNPNRGELENIFDLSYPTVQPYLFKIDYSLQSPPTNMSGQMRQFFRNIVNI